MRHTVTVPVAAPAPVAWAVLTDLSDWPTWTASMREVALEGGFEVGSSVRIRQPKLPSAQWTITEIEPGRSFTWESTAPGIRSVASHSVTATGSGASELTLSIDQSGQLGNVVAALYGRLTRRYVQMEADGLARAAAERA